MNRKCREELGRTSPTVWNKFKGAGRERGREGGREEGRGTRLKSVKQLEEREKRGFGGKKAEKVRLSPKFFVAIPGRNN